MFKSNTPSKPVSSKLSSPIDEIPTSSQDEVTDREVASERVLNDSIESLLDSHIGKFSEIITGTFIDSWSRDDGEEKGGEKDAFELSYHAVNDSIEEFDRFAADYKVQGDFDDGGEEIFDWTVNKILKVFCNQANGNMNLIVRQCRQLSDSPDTDLQEAAGAYLKEGFNAYLVEKYPDLYSEMSGNHESPELQVKDNISTSSSVKRKSDSQEIESDSPSSSISSAKQSKLTDSNHQAASL